MNATITRYTDPQQLDAAITDLIAEHLHRARQLSGHVRCLPGSSHADRYGPQSRIAILTYPGGHTLTLDAHRR